MHFDDGVALRIATYLPLVYTSIDDYWSKHDVSEIIAILRDRLLFFSTQKIHDFIYVLMFFHLSLSLSLYLSLYLSLSFSLSLYLSIYLSLSLSLFLNYILNQFPPPQSYIKNVKALRTRGLKLLDPLAQLLTVPTFHLAFFGLNDRTVHEDVADLMIESSPG